MPNHVFNTLTIEGPAKEIEKFQQELSLTKDTVFGIDHNKLIPYPEHYAKADEAHKIDSSIPDGYNHGGYEWCINNWGTKWGFYDFSDWVVQSTGAVTITFNTAWSIAEPLFKQMSKKYPKLRFILEVDEEGGFFAGEMQFEQGEITLNNIYEPMELNEDE